MTYRKKLIEVALPLEDINREAAREKSIRHGHPSTLHLWWARRPLAACRAVLFSSLVDDPSECVAELMADGAKRKAAEKAFAVQKKAWDSRKAIFDRAAASGMPVTSNPPPGLEPNLEDILVETERERLFGIIRELVKWENSNDERVLFAARYEIARSVAPHGVVPPTKPDLLLAFLAKHAPPVYDPFCGGGSIPLEAQRLGLEAHASDLNPVPVLINKALIEIPPKFAGKPPINPESRKKLSASGSWKGAAGLADDIRYYGQWIRNEAEKRIGHLYPKVKLPGEYGGGQAMVIAWLWTRTIKCPNPACRAEAPLVKSFWVSKRKGQQAYALPVLDKERRKVTFEVRTTGEAPRHTSDRTGGRCLYCDLHIKKAQLREIASRDGLGVMPFVIVADGPGGRVFLPSTSFEEIAVERPVVDFLQQPITNDKRWFSPPLYGLTLFSDLFTSRQLIALTTFQKLIAEVRNLVRSDVEEGQTFATSNASLATGSSGHAAYVDSIAIYLAFALDKMTDTPPFLSS